MNDSDVLSDLSEIELPEDTAESRQRRQARAKKPGVPRGAVRSPGFNRAWVPGRRDALKASVVRQPIAPEWMRKPLAPPGRANAKKPTG
jgi:hypothetical protein